MSIDSHPRAKSAELPPAPAWGGITPEGQPSSVFRFVLAERIVTFPATELRRWDHELGELEILTLRTSREEIVIEGRELTAIRAALDRGRLHELRLTPARAAQRPGPRVSRITINPA